VNSLSDHRRATACSIPFPKIRSSQPPAPRPASTTFPAVLAISWAAFALSLIVSSTPIS
jgi:hypothetical protein